MPTGTELDWRLLEKGVKAEAKKKGVNVVVAAGASDTDTTSEINAITNLLARGVNALVVTALGPQLAPILKHAQKQGVPVILVGNAVTGVNAPLITTADGQMAYQSSLAFVNNVLHKTGQVGILSFPAVSVVVDRVNGTKRAIKGTNITVVSELAANCDTNTALNDTTDMLQAHPQITAIFGECGSDTVGVLQALKAANRTDVKVVGYDAGSRTQYQAIESGEEYASVLQNWNAMGAKGVDLALDKKAHRSVPKNVHVAGTIITKANAALYKATISGP